jgi:hypothetical protein
MLSGSMRETVINRLVINMLNVTGSFLREYHAVGDIMPRNPGREHGSGDQHVAFLRVYYTRGIGHGLNFVGGGVVQSYDKQPWSKQSCSVCC